MQRDGVLTWQRLSDTALVVAEMRTATFTLVRVRLLLGILTRCCVYVSDMYCAASMVILAAGQPLLRDAC